MKTLLLFALLVTATLHAQDEGLGKATTANGATPQGNC